MSSEGEFLARAAAFIRREEGLRLLPYRCEAGYWTNGYGHRCEAGEGAITREVAESWLLSDVEAARRVVDRVPGLSVNQRVAIVSFVFNLGAAAFEKSTLRKMLVAGLFGAAAVELEKWVYIRTPGGMVVSKGLAARRARERLLFCEGLKWNG